MAFDFDAPPERRGTDSVKWARYAGRDVLPMWVADMDFSAPAEVLAALNERVAHGVFGYGDALPSANAAVVDAIARDHGWRIEPEWLVWLPGLVTGLNVVCRAVGERGDGVFTATPIYPPFLTAPVFSERELLRAELARDGARWVWDFDAVRAALTPRAKLFMLCNPHNPVGRAFTREELLEIARIAEERDLILCSDEIHCDLVLDPAAKHIPIASLDERIAARSITLMAASKSYNVPGLGCAFAIVPNPALRRRVHEAMRGIVPHPNILGYVATEAAYRLGKPWHNALIDYLRGNAQRVHAAINAMPGLATTPVEATYLAWIDTRELGLERPAHFFEQAGVGLSDGADFGAPGFVRLNFGCSRAQLDLALTRIAGALARRDDTARTA